MSVSKPYSHWPDTGTFGSPDAFGYQPYHASIHDRWPSNPNNPVSKAQWEAEMQATAEASAAAHEAKANANANTENKTKKKKKPLPDLPPWPQPPSFEPAYLDKRRKPEPTLPPNPPGTNPPKKAIPLAASQQPAEFYSQYKCPICTCTIAEEPGADYIGHTPCLHRGPCAKEACIRAYYGFPNKWATPYGGKKPLYCQAAGCGREIEGWCYVKAVMGPTGKAVMAAAQVDEEARRRWYKIKEERDGIERGEREDEGKRRMREEERLRKEEEKERKKKAGSVWDEIREYGSCATVLMACCLCCCPG